MSGRSIARKVLREAVEDIMGQIDQSGWLARSERFEARVTLEIDATRYDTGTTAAEGTEIEMVPTTVRLSAFASTVTSGRARKAPRRARVLGAVQ